MRDMRFQTVKKYGGWRSIICFTCIVSFSHFASAQSGRRAAPSPTPPPADARRAAQSAEPAVAGITSVIVTGEVVHGYPYYRSNSLDLALKECVNSLRDGRRVTGAAKGGKMSYNEAKERATKETDAYVLWISFVAKDDGYGNMLIDYVDYAVLMPRTARRLTHGRVEPGAANIVGRGGVLGMPPGARRSTRVGAAASTMKRMAREISDILVHGGWLGH